MPRKLTPSDYRRRKYREDGTINPDYTPRKRGDTNRHQKDNWGKFRHGQFCAWDGEGVTLADGRHIYTLLCNSRGGYLLDPDGLSTRDIFNFLLSESVKWGKHTIHVIFGGNYDIAMWLTHVDYDAALSLAQGDDIEWGARQYRIGWRDRKEFRLARVDDETPFLPVMDRDGNQKLYPDGRKRWKRNYIASIHIWDVFGFFQGSFVRACTEWLGADYPDLPMIAAGKLHRGDFTADRMHTEVLPYCQAEVIALEKLCVLLHQYLSDAGVTIRRWDGAGAIAAAMLEAHKIKLAKADADAPIEEAARHAFFGGRIEVIQYGHATGPIYRNDLRSAYPAAQARHCPNLARGHWVACCDPGSLPYTFAVWHVRWKLADDHAAWSDSPPICPFPYRDDDGMVSFPVDGQGWYWQPEVVAALQHLPYYQSRYPDARIEILAGYVFVEDDPTDRPFRWLQEYYDLRARLKKEGKGSQIIFKLGPNSCYGKTAQNKGYNPETGRRPPFHDLKWAGHITSTTRARLYRAAMQAPESVLFLATDGVYSTAPLDLPVSNRLGDWEPEIVDELIIAQSGVYFYRRGDDWTNMSRGFDKGTLSHEPILAAWERRETFVHFPSTRFVGLKSGTVTEDRYRLQCRRWVSICERNEDGSVRYNGRRLTLTSAGTKRRDRLERGEPVWTVRKRVAPPSQALIETRPEYNHTPDLDSRPYVRPWDRDSPYDTVTDADGTPIDGDLYNAEHMDTEI